jgi:hypothetical protein
LRYTLFVHPLGSEFLKECEMKAKTISIIAKCSDLFAAGLFDKDGNQIGSDYSDYVPDWFPGEHFGDYVELDIDVETGRILNWKTPTEAQLRETFKVK